MGRFTQRLGLMFCLSVGTTPVLADDLVSILDLAMQNDPSLKQAEAQYQSRHTLLDQGRALLMPSVALQGSTTRQTTGLAGQMSFRPGQNSHGYRLNLTQALFNLSAWYSYQSAQQSDQAGAITYAAQEQNLIIRVATAYFNVLRALDDLDTRRQEEEAAWKNTEVDALYRLQAAGVRVPQPYGFIDGVLGNRLGNVFLGYGPDHATDQAVDLFLRVIFDLRLRGTAARNQNGDLACFG